MENSTAPVHELSQSSWSNIKLQDMGMDNKIHSFRQDWVST